MTDRPTPTREPPDIRLRKCPGCREWMREGSAAAGECKDCGHRTPTQAAA